MVSKKNLTKVKLKTFYNCQNFFSTNFLAQLENLRKKWKRTAECLGSCFNRQYAYEGPVVSSFAEFNNAIRQCEQCEVSSNANIFSGVVFSSALAHENVSGDCRLTAINFYTEAFAL